jgi:isoleucyl-tRNA synthetase
VDFQQDVTVSAELMERISEIYRKFRNTFKNIINNLYDFEPEKHGLRFEDMLPLDQYMLLRTADLSERSRKWYESFEFHRVYHELHDFCAVDLSNVYFDVLKDRLYTAAPKSRARRSAQTALWRIGEALVRLLAPMMSFTADEVWSFLPKISGREESVHLAYFLEGSAITGSTPEQIYAQTLRADFDSLMNIRAEALKALEVARQEKLIGSSLEAMVTIHAPDSLYKLLERYRDDMRYLLIVSGVNIVHASGGNGNVPLHVEVSKAPGKKCERCWNYSVHVGEEARYPTLCERCVAALKEMEQV